MADRRRVTVAITTYNKSYGGVLVRSSMYLNIARAGRDDVQLQAIARGAMSAAGLLSSRTESVRTTVVVRLSESGS